MTAPRIPKSDEVNSFWNYGMDSAAISKWHLSCPHCEYDRRFPGFELGGWMHTDNNGPIVACPVCNPYGQWTCTDTTVEEAAST